MAKEREKDLRRGPDPLDLYGKPSIGERVRDAVRDRLPKRRGHHLPTTPPEDLKLTERPVDTIREIWMNNRENWVWKSVSPTDREQVERLALSRINTFIPYDWIPASIVERMTAIQALENRIHTMQGRTEIQKINVADLDKGVGSILELGTNTITIDEELVKRSNPAMALRELFKQLHILMQRAAVRNPRAYREHGVENIERWAEPKDGQPSYSGEDAKQYAIRQTRYLQVSD